MAQGILMNDDYTPVIAAGDFVLANTDEQDLRLLILAHKGELVSKPLRGFGASRYLNRRDPDLAPSELSREMAADGFLAIKTQIDPVTFEIVAGGERAE